MCPGRALRRTRPVRACEACRAWLACRPVYSRLRPGATRAANAAGPGRADRTRHAAGPPAVVCLPSTTGIAETSSPRRAICTRLAPTLVGNRHESRPTWDANCPVVTERAGCALVAIVTHGIRLLPGRASRARLHVQSSACLVVVPVSPIHTHEAMRCPNIKHDRVRFLAVGAILAVPTDIRKLPWRTHVTHCVLGIRRLARGTCITRYTSA